MRKSVSDKDFMDLALALARRASSWTNPNPLVGTVVVKDDVIIGRGYHRRVGSAHAEIDALGRASASVKGATLYVTLEPCAHHGRTPPCVEAIVKAGINRVVCAVADPNPKVAGRGLAKLEEAGVDVSVGCRELQARRLNESFFAFHTHRRPFIAIKFAASLDGSMATGSGDSKWITNEMARTYGRRLRADYQAVLVGITTILRDDPHLGVRLRSRRDPLRIVLDSRLRIPLDAQVLRNNNVLIATTAAAAPVKRRLLKQRGIPLLEFKGKHVPLGELSEVLRKQEIISVLVEGGGETIGSFIDEKLVDKVYAFYAPLLIGGQNSFGITGQGVSKVSEALRLRDTSMKKFEDNFLVCGYV